MSTENDTTDDEVPNDETRDEPDPEVGADDLDNALRHLLEAEAHLAEAVEDATGHLDMGAAATHATDVDTAPFEAVRETLHEARDEVVVWRHAQRRDELRSGEEGADR